MARTRAYRQAVRAIAVVGLLRHINLGHDTPGQLAVDYVSLISPMPFAAHSAAMGDRTTAFWNPFRKVWVYSTRHGWGVPRARRYWEVKDILTGPQWTQINEPGSF